MKQKVLFLIYSLGKGGAEKVLVNIVNNLDAQQFEITVQTYRNDDFYKKDLRKNIKYKSIINVKNKLIRRFVSRILSNYVLRKLLYKVSIRERYDFEIAFVEGITTSIISNSSNINSKKIAWIHCDMSSNNYSLKDYKGINDQFQSYKRFDEIVVVTENAREGFKKQFGDEFPLRVISNWIDVNEIIEKSKLPVSTNTARNRINILAIGRLDKNKGYHLLVRAVKRLVISGYLVNLQIIGEGRERASLEHFINTNQLGDVIQLLGFQTNPYNYLNNSQIFVCSSLTEGYSLAIAEALLLGKPIVSTKCAGPNELLENGKYGYMVDMTEEGIFNGLEMMMNEDVRNEYRTRSVEGCKKLIMKNELIKLQIQDLLQSET